MPANPAAHVDVARLNSAARALATHWPEYLIEAAGLGVFMLVAGLAGTALEYRGSTLFLALRDDWVRRALMGLAMGCTSCALVYSPWGKRSGAHFNPALTLAFLYAGKVRPWDAVFYITAQFVGGLAGVFTVLILCGNAFAAPPVSFIVTVPGVAGVEVAFMCEWLISFGLMSLVLVASNHRRWRRYTGVLCGLLIAFYVTVEAPFSGMSMNPARTVASALPSGIWTAGWLYVIAPISAMLVSTMLYQRFRPFRAIACAKLSHGIETDCIFVCNFFDVFAPQDTMPTPSRNPHRDDIPT